MESRWQPWLLKVWGPYGTSNLPFFWLLAVRHKLWQLEGRCGHQLSRPPLHMVSGSKSWLQWGHSRASKQPASYLLRCTQAGLPGGLLGMVLVLCKQG